MYWYMIEVSTTLPFQCRRPNEEGGSLSATFDRVAYDSSAMQRKIDVFLYQYCMVVFVLRLSGNCNLQTPTLLT